MNAGRSIRAQMLAVSTAGHDRGSVYVIVGEEEDFLLAADGKLKLLASPKRKNRKHLQKIVHIPEELSSMMEEIRDDADLRRILKRYRQMQSSNTIRR